MGIHLKPIDLSTEQNLSARRTAPEGTDLAETKERRKTTHVLVITFFIVFNYVLLLFLGTQETTQ